MQACLQLAEAGRGDCRLWLTLSTIVHATSKVQNTMTACVMAVAMYYSTIALITTQLDVPHETKATIWGTAGGVALIAYYSAPLTTLIKVIRRRDSSSLYPPLCIMNFVNMLLWINYGIAIHNPFIWVPECVGAVLSTTALVLLLIFPRRERRARSNSAILESGPAQADPPAVPWQPPLNASNAPWLPPAQAEVCALGVEGPGESNPASVLDVMREQVEFFKAWGGRTQHVGNDDLRRRHFGHAKMLRRAHGTREDGMHHAMPPAGVSRMRSSLPAQVARRATTRAKSPSTHPMRAMASGGKPFTLYTAGTPNGWKASIPLEELGVPHNVRAISLSKNEQKEDWFLRINPNGRIPALVDHEAGDLAIFESGAIMWYLAEKADPNGLLAPKDLSKKAEVMSWLMFQMGGVGPMQGQANHFNRYAPEKIPYAINRYVNETNRLYEVLEKHLANHEWLAADQYTIADIANFCWVYSHDWAGVSLDDKPHLKAWLEKIEKRPAVQCGLDVPEPNMVKKAKEDPEFAKQKIQEAQAMMVSTQKK
ncbi:hypothetical protein WJX72_004467 [[Myrmecia] bisecta]|uniref:Sugar transporter SWEET1 n=1 Tax=[Myrmecia] bisecta TaxID=41462 RepID=A0AAW1PKX8_9CHLO